MNVKDYLYFKIIVDEGSLSKAANRIGVSQPYLSGFITSLENKCGYILIERKCKPLKLTDNGILFYASAEKIVQEEEYLKNALKSKESSIQRIRIAVGSTRAKYLLDKIIIDYVKQSNKNVIELKEIINEDASKTIQNNEADIVIHYGKIDDLQSLYLLAESLQFVALKDVAGGYGSFKEMPFISLHKDQAIRRLYNSFINEKNILLECNSIDTAIHYVKQGVGATIAPDYVTNTLDKKRFITSSIDGCQKRDVYVSFKDKKYLPNYVINFINNLIKRVKQEGSYER